MKKKTKNPERDYEIDPITRRATFKKNNKAALLHGGYSKQIDPNLIDAAMENDLGWELGVLKSQVLNIETEGAALIKELKDDGRNEEAFEIMLNCQKSALQAVPRIIKLLETNQKLSQGTDEDTHKKRASILKKLNQGKITAIQAAYQFEVEQLGDLPSYVKELVNAEAKVLAASAALENEAEGVSRVELEKRLTEYWNNAKAEEKMLSERKEKIDQIKQKVREQSE